MVWTANCTVSRNLSRLRLAVEFGERDNDKIELLVSNFSVSQIIRK
jgi:hypothetical protein